MAARAGADMRNCLYILLITFVSCSPARYISRAGKELISTTAHTGISIYDAGRNKSLYRYHGDKYFVPASNTKIFTLYAGMKYLGDSLTGIRYRETADSLIIYPSGDPTLLHPGFQNQPVADMLKSTRKIIAIDTTIFKEKIFGRGWAWDDDEINQQAARSAMPGLEKMAGVPFVFVTSPPYGLLRTLHSQHADSLYRPMMHNSDNFFAEQVLLMASAMALGIMNDRRIIDTLLNTHLKELPQKPNWVDGSGLSRYNVFTPDDFVWVLNKMKDEFGLERMKKIFATGGQGTLKNYYLGDAGYIFAKTGTLTGQIALSGFMVTKKGRLLLFSVLINNHHAPTAAIRSSVEKFLTGIRARF